MVVFLLFLVIAIMRVIQKICSKKVSCLINSKKLFFHYGGFYNLVAALLSFITLFIFGLDGINTETFVCALITAILFAGDLYTGIEAIKGTSLVVCNMFALGGLFVPCIIGIFLFDEPMVLPQWIGLGTFLISIYFITYTGKTEKKAFTIKTLIMLILSFLINGFVMVVQKYFAIKVPNGNVPLYSALTFVLNAIMLYSCMFLLSLRKVKVGDTDNNKESSKIERLSKVLLICGTLLALAVFTINLLITTLAESVSSVILYTASSLLSIVITCIVGRLVFKEKMNVMNIIGIIIGALTIVLINVF